jgi:hypothetical protein
MTEQEEKWAKEDQQELVTAAMTGDPAKVKEATERIRKRRAGRQTPIISPGCTPVGFAGSKGVHDALYGARKERHSVPWFLRDL